MNFTAIISSPIHILGGLAMFHNDVTFVLSIFALVAGAALLLFAKVHRDLSTKPCRVIGYIAVILSVLMLLCSGYSMVRSYAMKCQMQTQMMQKMKEIMVFLLVNKKLTPNLS